MGFEGGFWTPLTMGSLFWLGDTLILWVGLPLSASGNVVCVPGLNVNIYAAVILTIHSVAYQIVSGGL